MGRLRAEEDQLLARRDELRDAAPKELLDVIEHQRQVLEHAVTHINELYRELGRPERLESD